MRATNSVLKIQNLGKKLGKFQLRDITLSLDSREYLVILGPSGCGKTSLLESIAGIKTVDQGKIWAHGVDITQMPIEKRDIGFVYQKLMLFPHMTVLENVLYGLKIKKLPQKEEKAQEILKVLGIADLKNRSVLTLSGGEQQRVALARALVIRPQILLLDEPLSALDPMTKNRSIDLLKEIWEELGQTIIHVTHDHVDAMNLATKIGVMNEGKLIQVDSVHNIFQKPASRFIADFTCAENVFEGIGEIQGQKTAIQIGNPGKKIRIWSEEKREGKLNLLINPANINISLNGDSRGENVYKGQVVSVRDLNQMIKLTVDIGVPFTVNLTKQVYQDLRLQLGTEINLSFQTSSTHLF